MFLSNVESLHGGQSIGNEVDVDRGMRDCFGHSTILMEVGDLA
jgi:hypothetical protein